MIIEELNYEILSPRIITDSTDAQDLSLEDYLNKVQSVRMSPDIEFDFNLSRIYTQTDGGCLDFTLTIEDEDRELSMASYLLHPFDNNDSFEYLDEAKKYKEDEIERYLKGLLEFLLSNLAFDLHQGIDTDQYENKSRVASKMTSALDFIDYKGYDFSKNERISYAISCADFLLPCDRSYTNNIHEDTWGYKIEDSVIKPVTDANKNNSVEERQRQAKLLKSISEEYFSNAFDVSYCHHVDFNMLTFDQLYERLEDAPACFNLSLTNEEVDVEIEVKHLNDQLYYTMLDEDLYSIYLSSPLNKEVGSIEFKTVEDDIKKYINKYLETCLENKKKEINKLENQADIYREMIV